MATTQYTVINPTNGKPIGKTQTLGGGRAIAEAAGLPQYALQYRLDGRTVRRIYQINAVGRWLYLGVTPVTVAA